MGRIWWWGVCVGGVGGDGMLHGSSLCGLRMARRTAWSDGDGAARGAHGACMQVIDWQLWGGAAQRQTARQQLLRVERMARQNARSSVRPLGMERRVARGVVEFWLVLAWWMLERATDGGPSGQIITSADRLEKRQRGSFKKKASANKNTDATWFKNFFFDRANRLKKILAGRG
jgi:hypothetical protein